MNVCVYTGAYVLFAEWGAHAVADMYNVGNAILVRWSGELNYDDPTKIGLSDTHIVRVGHGLKRDDIKIALVRVKDVEPLTAKVAERFFYNLAANGVSAADMPLDHSNVAP